jgi:hypothetical protein
MNWLRDPSIDPTTSPALGAPTGPGALYAYAAYTGGVNIPGTNIDIPLPTGAAEAVGEIVPGAVKDAVGQTTQSIFSAILGPGAELLITGVLALGGVALVLLAVTSATRNSKINQEGTAALKSALPAML